MKKVSILDMAEDLLDEDKSEQRSNSPKIKKRNLSDHRSRLSDKSTLDVLITEAAKTLGATAQEIRDWTHEAVVPENVLKLILTTAKRHKLNPLLRHIDWELNSKDEYEIYIPIDGWIALIHRQPTFQGITFDQSPESENGIPIWMECAIYRSDLTHPIKVREYYEELKKDHPMWTQMPRRMMRYKTLQQCARLAFEVSVYVSKVHLTPVNEAEMITIEPNQKYPDCKNLLRQKLNNHTFLHY